MWFVTLFEEIEPYEKEENKNLPVFWNQKTLGYFAEKYKAIDCLHVNYLDVDNDDYDYAVLEKFNEGIYPGCEERQFFRYDSEADGYYEIDPPDFVKNITCFALG